jgi:voltage-gated potassium channel Kch
MRLNISFPVAVSLFNENVAPHLQAAYPNLTILSPARMAAPVFAEALNRQVEHRLRYTPAGRPGEIKVKVADRLVVRLIAGFIALIFFSTTYFHYSEHISWLDAFYFVVVTITSVGYGDITLLHSAAISKVLNIVLILSATVFIWMIFSLVIDRIIKKRIQLSLGQKQYDYKNHVIVCGLGRLGYCIVEELIKAGEKVIVVQNNADSDKADELRLRGVDVYVGNARSFAVLQDVNVINARGLISVIDNDYLNLEIGLNARSIRSDLPLVLRIVDEEMAVQLREDLDIHLTLSMSDLADDRFMSLLKNKTD